MKLFGIILFAFANIAGPWLCCCTPALFLKPKPVEVVNQVVEPTCPHCKESQKDNSPVEKSQEPVKSPLKPCPCQSQAPIEMIAVDGKDHRTAAVVLALPPVVTGDLFEVIEIVSTSAAVGVSELPFLTAEERLYVHHALRC